VVFILFDARDFFGFEKKVVGHQLEDHTSQREDISVIVILMPYYYFRRSVLTGLNIISKVFVSKASVAHISYLKEEFVVQFYLYIFPNQRAHINTVLDICVVLLVPLNIFALLLFHRLWL
jgi:hypothetical protein